MKKYLILYLLLSPLFVFSQMIKSNFPFGGMLKVNPAFAGATNKSRIQSSYYNLFPSLSSGSTQSYFGIDTKLLDYNSGFGMFLEATNEGGGLIKSTQFGLNYSYTVTLGDENGLNLGISPYLSSVGLDKDKLIFPDQISTGGSIIPTKENLISGRLNNFNSGLGVLFFSPKFWIGLSTNALLNSSKGFINTIKFNRIINAHFLYKIDFDEYFRTDEISKNNLSIVGNYSKEGKINQLYLGTKYFYKGINVSCGYKGLPFAKNEYNFIRNESLLNSIGFSDEKFSFSYIFEKSFSTIGSNGNGHQIFIVFKFEPLETNSKRRRYKEELKMPEF